MDGVILSYAPQLVYHHSPYFTAVWALGPIYKLCEGLFVEKLGERARNEKYEEVRKMRLYIAEPIGTL
jgi:hypothetical protein